VEDDAAAATTAVATAAAAIAAATAAAATRTGTCPAHLRIVAPQSRITGEFPFSSVMLSIF
jgi:hypothetical protein